MILHPDNILLFGKHKGHKLSEIYRFCPDYLEWAITYKENFVLDIDEFNKLPKPTPFVKRYKINIGTNEAYTIDPTESVIPHAYEVLNKGEIIKEIEYKFSDKIIEINKLKLLGKYVIPPWSSLNSKLKN